MQGTSSPYPSFLSSKSNHVLLWLPNPQSGVIASSTGEALSVWQVSTGRCLHTYKAPVGEILALSWEREENTGQKLRITSAGYGVHAWQQETH